MRLSSRSPPEATLPATLAALLFLAAPASVSGASFLRCGELVVDGHKFDFSPLKGPHTITTSEFHPPTYSNTTYTLDLCAYLKRKDDVKKGDECPNNTRGECLSISPRWEMVVERYGAWRVTANMRSEND